MPAVPVQHCIVGRAHGCRALDGSNLQVPAEASRQLKCIEKRLHKRRGVLAYISTCSSMYVRIYTHIIPSLLLLSAEASRQLKIVEERLHELHYDEQSAADILSLARVKILG